MKPCAAPPLILASASPRRRRLLASIGYRFAVEPPAVDEAVHSGEDPAAYVTRLAALKARHVARPGVVVLAADTVVACGAMLLGKPRDDGEAARMLRQLSGCVHEVLTGVAVSTPSLQTRTHVERTRVAIAELDAATIRWYVDSGEPRDKAGAYAIQGLGAIFVERIEGNYANVVGLPLPAACRLLAAAGIALPNATLAGSRSTREPSRVGRDSRTCGNDRLRRR